MNPSVSVIMAVYNGAATVADAVRGILSQTYSDFEFIIIDDASTDDTPRLLGEWARLDSRIVIIRLDKNIGLTRALNIGLARARGRYIARQDADDVSYSDRLQKQVDMMTADPSLVLVGGVSDDVYSDGSTGRWRYHDPASIQKIVFRQTPFPHSTAFFRTDTARILGGYDEIFRTAQDMEFWMRMAKAGRLSMVADPILRRTVSDSSISARRRGRQFRDALCARWRHNPARRLRAVYDSCRSLLIAILPRGIVLSLKRCHPEHSEGSRP